ncbi:MAG: HEPN domain-containing protein, partial [bacterium]|nr:HEPN domain-containing protein [bacterium]
ADHDLGAARKLAEEGDRFLDVAIYHCQQAAEKAVKAFLIFHDQRISRTHDVQFLVTAAGSLNDGFSAWSEAAERLTPYATAFRYPDELMEPERAEFEEALSAADSFCGFVLSVLPEQVRPLGPEPAPNQNPETEPSTNGSEAP